ncbi:FAD-dependent oxidoreductase [Fundicoccus culcitae]|uniref:Alpha-glycerophosphate oxidase n=1 Tax=Fundicoccus culcitae TaxID=2969821 RepID=A0ABY5P7D2_9LACT|nr:FAD-dependent oxidoreductase [Fundicoccus culcitae]UUX34646.1 glycerol-3-phosphate dehydrogenase/oxidase [Fundicoccus culcitae]
MTALSIKNRPMTIESLQETEFDILIIGGGITGAAIAHQASVSGMQTALIDMQDFAGGTSSRSTKLVHGGIRYLKQFDIDVVSETVKERAVIQQIAPHIPVPSLMIMPIYEEVGAPFSLLEIETAMALYDQLAGITEGPWKHRMLSKEETMALLPEIDSQRLIGGGMYLDFRNNDSRLVIEHLKTAYQNKATILNYVKAVELVYADDQIVGVKVQDLITHGVFIIRAKVVVNAAGPWSDELREMDPLDHKPNQLRLTKGIHLVVDKSKLNVSHPVYFDTGLADGRMIFVLPQGDKTYFGTTDTDYRGDLNQPLPTQIDVDYLINIINSRFPKAHIQMKDIESSWAGLRPLIQSSAIVDYNGSRRQTLDDATFDLLNQLFTDYHQNNLSREEVEQILANSSFFKQETKDSPSSISRGSHLSVSPSGLVTIAGGKLTDYRQMANDVMKVVIERLKTFFQINIPAINSAHYKISGGEFEVEDYDQVMLTNKLLFIELGMNEQEADWLAKLYGSNSQKVMTYIDKASHYAERYHYPLALALALIYGIEEEGVCTIRDFLVMRTSLVLFHLMEVEVYIDSLLQTLAEELTLSAEILQQQRNLIWEDIKERRLGYLED